MGLFLPSLLVTLAVQIQASLVVFTPPVLAPIAQTDVGISAASVGIVTALIYLSSVPSALTAGLWINRFGPIRVSQLCVLFASTGIVMISSGVPSVIALGALIVGVGYGAVTPASSTVLADRVPDNMRSLIFSVKQSGVPIGGAIAGALVPLLMQLFGWNLAAICVGLLGIGVIIFAQIIRNKIDHVALSLSINMERLSLVEPLRFIFSHARLRELAISSFAFSGMQMSLGSYLVVMLTERAMLTISVAGSALSIAMIAGIVGRLLWGVLADHGIAARSVLGFLGLLMGLSGFFVMLINDTTSMTLIYIFSFLFGASAIGWNGVYLAEVARISPPGKAGIATGASLAMTYSGVVVLPSAFWVIHSYTESYASGFIILGGIALWRGIAFFSKDSPSKKNSD